MIAAVAVTGREARGAMAADRAALVDRVAVAEDPAVLALVGPAAVASAEAETVDSTEALPRATYPWPDRVGW